jgi:very-short-patch-repair endonuclease
MASGRWERPFPGVYRIAGIPQSWLGDLWCAFLAVGDQGVVTHETALRMHGIECVAPRPLTFTVPHGGHAYVRGTFVHQIDDLRPHRVTRVSGLPVSCAARAVVEVAATLGPKQLERTLDAALHTKRASLSQINACFREVLRPGKPGIAKLVALLDLRDDGYVPPASELERALFGALRAGGLPEPRRQFPLPGRGAVDGLVDAAYPDVRLIIEADGRRWHTRIEDFRRDRQRDAEAARAGWQTLRLTYAEIAHDPGELCNTVGDIRAARMSNSPRK